jgi:hypothetical protein
MSAKDSERRRTTSWFDAGSRSVEATISMSPLPDERDRIEVAYVADDPERVRSVRTGHRATRGGSSSPPPCRSWA